MLGTHRHVVAQVVESELVVGAVRDIALVLEPTVGRIHLVLDAPDRESEELVDLAHHSLSRRAR
jgi:hypothetical protein